MLHLFIQSSDEKHFPRQVSFVIDLLRNIQSNTGHTKASNMSWHPILGYCVSSPGTVRDQRIFELFRTKIKTLGRSKSDHSVDP